MHRAIGIAVLAVVACATQPVSHWKPIPVSDPAQGQPSTLQQAIQEINALCAHSGSKRTGSNAWLTADEASCRNLQLVAYLVVSKILDENHESQPEGMLARACLAGWANSPQYLGNYISTRDCFERVRAAYQADRSRR